MKPTVKLIGKNGNAIIIMSKTIKALKKAGYSVEDIDRYQNEAMAGNYDNLLRVTMEWVEVE